MRVTIAFIALFVANEIDNRGYPWLALIILLTTTFELGAEAIRQHKTWKKRKTDALSST